MHRTRKLTGIAALGSTLLCATAIGGCSFLVSVEGLSDPTPVDASIADLPDTSHEMDAGSHDPADAEAGTRPRIFVVGGSEDGTTFPDVTPVRYAEIQDDGMLGPWQLGAPLPKPAMWHAAAKGNDFIALVGGLTKPEGGNTRVVIGAVTGGLVASYFTSSPVLPTPRNHAGAVVRGPTLYVFGGIDGNDATSDVLAAEVGPSTVSAFSVHASLPSPIARMGFAETDNAIFLVGGGNETTPRGVSITKGTFLPDGGVAFTAEASLPEAQRYGTACVHDDVLLVLGGEGASTDIATVLVYPISAEGKLGPYRTTTPLPYSRSRSRVIAYNHRIYIVGGRGTAGGDARDVLVGDLEPTGGVKSWRTTSPLPTTLTFHTATLVL